MTQYVPGKEKPTVCQIELVRGCNYSCSFCAIEVVPKQAIPMADDTVIKMAEELSVFDPLRIEFAMRGEPTLFPATLNLATSALRSTCPESQITLTTNGSKLTDEIVVDFFKSGGNIIIVDCYGKTFEKYKKQLEKFNPINYYDNQWGFSPWNRHKPSTKIIVLMPDIGQGGNKSTRVINNQAGNVNFAKTEKLFGVKPLIRPLIKKCVHPFREIVIFQDGTIPICCRDWKQEAIYWDVFKGDLLNYWHNNPKLNAARRLLNEKKRDFGICQRCDYFGGHYQGFLPATEESTEADYTMAVIQPSKVKK
jgi:Radical SAM superfamily/Iron-sulfur cluster-binding domain